MLQHQSFGMDVVYLRLANFVCDILNSVQITCKQQSCTYVYISILSRNPYFGRQFLPQGVARDQRTGNISWLVGPPAPAANKHLMKSTFFSAAAI